MIVVTGASRGIGAAISERLRSKGELVVGLARDAQQLPDNGITCDIRSYQSVKQAVKRVKACREPVRAVVNAAGVASMNLAVTTDESSVQRLIQTNLMGTIYSCQLFAPMMLRQKSGSFINFSTIAVPLALKGESVYAASKAGVEVFSKSFAREVSSFNVRVNCIAPGPIRTDLLKGVSDKQIEDIVAQQIIQTPFEKDDICDLVELLLDKRSDCLSGQIFNVGGV